MVGELLQQVRALDAALSAHPADAVLLADDELLTVAAELEAFARKLAPHQVAVAAEIVARSDGRPIAESLAVRNGHRRGRELVELVTRVSAGEVRQRLKAANAITARTPAIDGAGELLWPHLATAFMAGQIEVDAAALIGRTLRRASIAGASAEQLAGAEFELTGAAKQAPVDIVARMADVWVAYLDPDGSEPRERAQRASRRFTMGVTRGDGMTPFHGLADPVSAGILQEAFRTFGQPPAREVAFEEPGDPDASWDAPVDGPSTRPDPVAFEDTRTWEQRRFDTLMGLITAGITAECGKPGAPLFRVNIAVALDDLKKGTGPAFIDGITEPISVATVNEALCDADIGVTVLGNEGAVLFHGQGKRLFTPAIRQAVSLRDGGCINVLCTSPPGMTHIHHVRWYHRDQGATDIDNAVCLCSACHHLVHALGFQIRMVDGVPRVMPPTSWGQTAVQFMSGSRIRALLRKRTA